MDNLSIDIIVPTYNRPEDIKKFINEIAKQTYLDYKVFIVDDCGDYEIKDILPKNPDKIYYEKLNQNYGQAYARNHAVKKGSGDIVIFMDDDAWFYNDDALSDVVHYFSSDPFLGALMFNVKEPGREWLAKRKNLKDSQELGNFIACGCAFSRKAFERTNGFSPIFHSYGEETELTMQLIKNEDKVKFGKRIKVYHNYNPTERNKTWVKRFKHNSVRNDLLIVLTRFPIYLAPLYFGGKFMSHLLYGFKSPLYWKINFLETFHALISSIRLYKKTNRDPLTFSQFQYWISKRI